MLLFHMFAHVAAITAAIITQNTCIFAVAGVSTDVCLLKIQKNISIFTFNLMKKLNFYSHPGHV